MQKPWLACAVFTVLVSCGGAWLAAAPSVGHGHVHDQAAGKCTCGCGGTPRPSCAHSCKGVPCTGATMSHSRIVAGEVVEQAPATLTVVAANGAALQGFVMDLGRRGQMTTDAKGQVVLKPDSRNAIQARIENVTGATISMIAARDAAGAASKVPRYATVGSDVSVTRAGLFDGRAENTTATVGSTTCHVLFEAPHQAILAVPGETPLGTATLKLQDGGRTFEQPMRLVRLGISADDLQLERGVMTNGRVTIEGADDTLVGGVIRLENLSTEIIELEVTGMRGSDSLQRRIEKGMIKDGSITIPLTIRGRQRGPFTVVATLFDPEALTSARCSCGCGGTPRPACAHSCKGNPCTGTTIRR